MPFRGYSGPVLKATALDHETWASQTMMPSRCQCLLHEAPGKDIGFSLFLNCFHIRLSKRRTVYSVHWILMHEYFIRQLPVSAQSENDCVGIERVGGPLSADVEETFENSGACPCPCPCPSPAPSVLFPGAMWGNGRMSVPWVISHCRNLIVSRWFPLCFGVPLIKSVCVCLRNNQTK